MNSEYIFKKLVGFQQFIAKKMNHLHQFSKQLKVDEQSAQCYICSILFNSSARQTENQLKYIFIIDFILGYQRYMEVDSNCYAIYLDNSDSVRNSVHYWQTVNDILKIHSKNISCYYLWNSKVHYADRKKYEEAIFWKRGAGGTCPEEVAKTIISKHESNVILITDGQVTDSSVKKCDEIFQSSAGKFKILKIICYIISSSSAEVDMSVTCPFTRYCSSKVFVKRKDEPLKVVTSYSLEDYKLLDTLGEITLANLVAKYDVLQNLIISMNMGKSGNIQLKNQIVMMKNRLVHQISKKMTGENNYSQRIRDQLENSNFFLAIQICKEMDAAYFSDSMTFDLQRKISHLINLCGDLRGKYAINEIKSNKMATAKQAMEGKLDRDIQMLDLSKHLIECPIIMDEDVPQIMIDECQPLLMGIDKSVVQSISICPLRILNYPDLKQKLKSKLSNFIGVKVGDRLVKNPFTQNRLLGAIPLGAHHSHIKVGNYTIAKLITDGKVLGNLNMYYAAIWHLIYQDGIEYLKQIKANATEHLIYRLKNSKTTASLSGQAQFVTTEVSLDVAVWYCVNSGYLNQPTNRDVFRFHLMNLDPMINITKVLGYQNHQGLGRHQFRTRMTLSLLARIKKLKLNDRKSVKNLFLGLYQNGIFVNLKAITPKFKERQVCVNFIPIDGPASPEQITKIRGLLLKDCNDVSNEELYYISTLVDANKSSSAIFLDYHMKIPDLPKFEINWCYGLKEEYRQVKICPATFRPYYYVNGATWEQEATQTYHVDKTIHLFRAMKYTEAYIIKYKKRPSVDELKLFFYNRQIQSGKQRTLPYLTEQWISDVIQAYSVAFKEESIIDEIIDTFNKSRKITTRVLLEKQIKQD